MTPSPNQQGNEAEMDAMRLLTGQGYTLHRNRKATVPTPKGPRTVQQDIFGLIDIIAKKRGEPTRWIQVSRLRSVAAKIREVDSGPWEAQHDRVEVWQWKEATATHIKHFQVYKRSEGYAKVFANRLAIP